MARKPKSRPRENIHRIGMAVIIVFAGIALSFTILILISSLFPHAEMAGFHYCHVEWCHDRTTFVAGITCFGGLDVGAGTGSFSCDQPNLHYAGYGMDLLGFQLSNYSYLTNNGNAIGQWRLFGLPWWFIVALIFGPQLDRYALRRGALNDARRLRLRRSREAIDGWEDYFEFKRKPVCRICGYDMRATLTRCPECGWIPDFPRPLTEREARRGY